jgi:hypothetical protein
MIENCPECGRDKKEYDRSWKCAKLHDWRGNWRKDKTSEKYKEYLKRRNASMKKKSRERLEKLNKTTPIVYANRSRINVKEK